jgi:hypothetical protein
MLNFPETLTLIIFGGLPCPSETKTNTKKIRRKEMLLVIDNPGKNSDSRFYSNIESPH